MRCPASSSSSRFGRGSLQPDCGSTSLGYTVASRFCRWVERPLGSAVIAGAADVLVDQQRRLGDGGGGMLAVVLQDGGNRAVEAGAEHQRPSAGGVSCVTHTAHRCDFGLETGRDLAKTGLYV